MTVKGLILQGHNESESDYNVHLLQLKPGTIGKDLEGFHSRLDKSAPGAAEVIAPSCFNPLYPN